jgi:allophanate hydrolase subunit 2
VLLPQFGEQIRILPGPEYDEFEADAREALIAATWIVSTQSNRMAYRLDGPPLKRERGTDLRSHAVFPGVVQVPPGGTPMVLMADAQATGGYPRIASVIAADLGRLAQRRPATALHFALETRAGARVAWQKQQTYLQRLRRSLLQ